MKYVYKLVHKHRVEDVDLVYDTKLIGFYSTLEKVNLTIERYKKIEGFKDYPEGFMIEKYLIDKENSQIDNKSIFYLQHFYEDGDYDIVTNIGVYASLEKAQTVLNKSKKRAKFKDHLIVLILMKLKLMMIIGKKDFLPISLILS